MRVLIAMVGLLGVPASLLAQDPDRCWSSPKRSAVALYPGTKGLDGMVWSMSVLAPLPQTTIILEPSLIVAHTDSLGRFSLPTLAPGTYSMLVRAVGYAPVRDTITVGRVGLRVGVALIPGGIRDLECTIPGPIEPPPTAT